MFNFGLVSIAGGPAKIVHAMRIFDGLTSRSTYLEKHVFNVADGQIGLSRARLGFQGHR